MYHFPILPGYSKNEISKISNCIYCLNQMFYPPYKYSVILMYLCEQMIFGTFKDDCDEIHKIRVIHQED